MGEKKRVLFQTIFFVHTKMRQEKSQHFAMPARSRQDYCNKENVFGEKVREKNNGKRSSERKERKKNREREDSCIILTPRV